MRDVALILSSWWFRGVAFGVPAALRDRRGRLLLLTAIAYGLASLVANALKLVFRTARPPASGALVPVPTTYSFPSGHTATAFAAATVLALLVRHWWLWTYPVAAAVGWSRLELGVHHPIDVIGGAVIGVLVGLAVVQVSKIGRLRALQPSWSEPSSRSPSPPP